MSSMRSYIGTCLLLIASVAQTAEHDDADILPKILSLQFSAHEIGVLLGGYQDHGFDYPPFVVDTMTHVMRSVTNDEFAKHFDPDHPVQKQRDEYLTSQGTRFQPHDCRSEPYAVLEQLKIGDRVVPVQFDECFAISEIEVVDNVVWVGSYYAGSHGDWGAQGLFAVDIDSGKILARIDTGERALLRVRLNPFTKNVWAMTPDQTVVVDQSLNVVRRFMFHWDFNADTGMPEVQIANEVVPSHPLAVFALALPFERRAEFFSDVQTIPDEIARTFDLYEFHMCCYFRTADDGARFVQDLNILVPYLRSAFELNMQRYEKLRYGLTTKQASRFWRQVACWFREDPEAERLCETEDWATLRTQSH